MDNHSFYVTLDHLFFFYIQRKYGSEFDNLIKAAREAKRLKEEEAKANTKSNSTPTPEESKCECLEKRMSLWICPVVSDIIVDLTASINGLP
jgi:hypothetical protein